LQEGDVHTYIILDISTHVSLESLNCFVVVNNRFVGADERFVVANERFLINIVGGIGSHSAVLIWATV